MLILSLCTSAGLWDRALIEAGHEVVAGCEIAPHKRAMYMGSSSRCLFVPDSDHREAVDWIVVEKTET